MQIKLNDVIEKINGSGPNLKASAKLKKNPAKIGLINLPFFDENFNTYQIPMDINIAKGA